MDRQELFLHPVSRAEVPDYFDIIKEPMSWLQMDEKIEKTAYRHVADFKVRDRRSLSLTCSETSCSC
jgi:NuA3 HAT complex component NTO1